MGGEPSDTPGQHHARPHIHKQTKSFMKVKIRIILQIFKKEGWRGLADQHAEQSHSVEDGTILDILLIMRSHQLYQMIQRLLLEHLPLALPEDPYTQEVLHCREEEML